MTVEDLEKAVANLTGRELERFRAWFEQFDAARFDQKIERDAQSGGVENGSEIDHRPCRCSQPQAVTPDDVLRFVLRRAVDFHRR